MKASDLRARHTSFQLWEGPPNRKNSVVKAMTRDMQLTRLTQWCEICGFYLNTVRVSEQLRQNEAEFLTDHARPRSPERPQTG